MKCYERDLLKLLCNYSYDDKYADDKFIFNSFSFIIKELDLDDFIKNIYLESNCLKDKVIAEYFFRDKYVSFYMNSKDYLVNHQFKLFDKSNSKEKLFFKNCLILQTILHECEHANQMKKIDKSSNLESDVLNISFFSNNKLIVDTLRGFNYSDQDIKSFYSTICKIKSNNYYNNYIHAPEERLAEINSIIRLIKIIEPVKHIFVDTYNAFMIKLYSNYLIGYKKNNDKYSPTINYLKESGFEFVLPGYKWFNNNDNMCFNNIIYNYSFDDRVKTGLYITDFEYNNLLNKKKLFKKTFYR